ncbi:MAG: hypothetical protein H0W67_08360 [Gemmatimonadales bacterium]|nr:hypothetical protein [Gemmatimonadales bacterium]
MSSKSRGWTPALRLGSRVAASRRSRHGFDPRMNVVVEFGQPENPGSAAMNN